MVAKFTLEIVAEGAAFADNNGAEELCRILSRLASGLRSDPGPLLHEFSRIEENYGVKRGEGCGGFLTDLNGNKCGRWELFAE